MIRYCLLLCIFFISCSEIQVVSKPDHLLSKKEMAEIIAELALSDQMGWLNPKGDMEANAQFILKEKKVQAKHFLESYNYYLASPRVMEDILKSAQNLIVDKDPKLKPLIEKQKATDGQMLYR